MPLKTLSGRHADPRKGRGAGTNPEGRFEQREREPFDDGWPRPDAEDELPALRTQVTVERAKSIISRNDSPDLSFAQSINPYQGCEHGCIYCMSGDTRILMADGRHAPLSAVRAGDEIYGTARRGLYRRYVKQKVLAHWSVIKPAYEVLLRDGTSLVAGGDHRFLTERGWKFVADDSNGQRPRLTTNNKLMGVGSFVEAVPHTADYRLGYLCGMVRGDGLIGAYNYPRPGRSHGNVYQFRLALCDDEALLRTREYLAALGIATHAFQFARGAANRKAMQGIRTHARSNVEAVSACVVLPDEPSVEWSAGFLAGIFDAEGSYSEGVLRISNTDWNLIEAIGRALTRFGFTSVTEHVERAPRPIKVVRVTGGLAAHLRFFHLVDPAIRRRCNIEGQALKSAARLQVERVTPLGTMRLYDITTETEDFIANGVVSHNCYARPSHAYQNLSPGIDFETRLFAKVNAAELLRAELSKPSYRCEEIMIGANTDPYQPIERDYRITRSVLETCAEFNQPIGIITKNAGIERDIDILSALAKKNLVSVTISCNNLDHDIARRLEPRCSAPRRRLQAMKALSDAGIPVSVLVAPVIPFLTDSQIETVLAAAWAHGARRAGYTVLRLPWEVKDLFREWLERHYPLKAKHIMSRVHAMRGGRDNDPQFGSRLVGSGEFAKLLDRRFQIARRRFGYRSAQEVKLNTLSFKVPGAGTQLSLI